MLEDNRNRCKNCQFWLRRFETDKGQCRRYPPTKMPDNAERMAQIVLRSGKFDKVVANEMLSHGASNTQWPIIGEAEWCGEHKRD